MFLFSSPSRGTSARFSLPRAPLLPPSATLLPMSLLPCVAPIIRGRPKTFVPGQLPQHRHGDHLRPSPFRNDPPERHSTSPPSVHSPQCGLPPPHRQRWRHPCLSPPRDAVSVWRGQQPQDARQSGSRPRSGLRYRSVGHHDRQHRHPVLRGLRQRRAAPHCHHFRLHFRFGRPPS